MLLVIPSITLKNGISKYKVNWEGDINGIYYSFKENPIEFVKLLRIENFKSFHIYDEDSFEYGNDNINLIKELVKSTDIPSMLEAYIPEPEIIETYLSTGIYRLILNDYPIRYTNQLKILIDRIGISRIAFKINLKQNLATWDYSEYSMIIEEYLHFLKNLGANRLIIGFDSKVKLKYEEKVNLISNMTDLYDFKLALTDIVDNTKELLSLNQFNNKVIDSVILSKPIYENAFPCQNIWREFEAENLIKK